MRGDTFLLSQLISSIEDALVKLEDSKNKGNIEEFNRIKKFILTLQEKIDKEAEKIQND